MKSTADIVTTDAARIAKRLVNHWKHKFEIEQESSSFTIIMPEARVLLNPQAEHLHVSIEASEEKLGHLEHVVLDHLIRMGQVPLTATWIQA
ncbi:DUF2218 domain-containing protein [Acinetobacter johnsonii]|uniref:DUF2218 domain-containing protein n=1 Tax=Acinetobacter johnsonii TaxID=40214 RepID=A0A345B234_ACIJO|nr:DUF2218 domain-containing protein [Acinetobacter johnsonii]AXF43502.1 DUF2218 domain-containing protein [Acinetobacter johnsonii]KUG39664.1 hypothetical protein AAU60_03345 [Acinetobacter johnsonii]MDH0712620.1 DUF2218 domain-containing protein [Acinetobacter johnsonii]MDH0836026.1 DUF2218 domain-containing protein [Acinetobacter johnsonii]MDH0839648.1 DUF2218 domain-containing protein [Acinetobacter johnsonii]